MALVGTAPRTDDFGTDHPIARVADIGQVTFRKRGGEARPAGPAFEFVAGREQRKPAQPAGISAFALLVQEYSAEGRFGAMLEQDVPLIVGQVGGQLLKLVVRRTGEIELSCGNVIHGDSLRRKCRLGQARLQGSRQADLRALP